jgi:hypothetical protein
MSFESQLVTYSTRKLPWWTPVARWPTGSTAAAESSAGVGAWLCTPGAAVREIMYGTSLLPTTVRPALSAWLR